MKVLFVACTDSPFDHNAGSGKDYDLYQALIRNGAEVKVVGPFSFKPTFPERVYRKVHSYLFKRRPEKFTDSFLDQSAQEVMKAIHENKPDVIFSKYADILWRVKTTLPIVILADTTLFGNEQGWPIFTRRAYLRQDRWEKEAYDRAKRIITHSRWSADTLFDHYQQPEEKVFFFPVPASLPASIIPRKISPKTLSPLKLLLVGRDYTRKGIDIAIDVVNKLNEEGVPTYLRIVGLNGDSSEKIEFRGSYNKTIPEQLNAYIENYRWANFLIHPARFEAGGIAPSEAAAFATPTITNDVGGLATTVADGVSGVVLPKLSPADAYVITLRNFVGRPETYEKLCRSTKKRYDEMLNWEAAGKNLFKIIEGAVSA